MTVDEALIADYQQNGCAVLRGIFGPWIEGLRQGIEENMAAPSFRERTYQPGGDRAPFFQDFCNWDRIDGFRALVRESPMAETAAKLMRSKTARIFH
ncbi:MAG: phytanoyl-CoA dioxygenase, partial [Xanthomonadales bacterium]|nr:phytanoyl-CoA dioxygenase [Xanthomonadales bacterium]